MKIKKMGFWRCEIITPKAAKSRLMYFTSYDPSQTSTKHITKHRLALTEAHYTDPPHDVRQIHRIAHQQQRGSSLTILCGLRWHQIFENGREAVSCVHVPRFTSSIQASTYPDAKTELMHLVGSFRTFVQIRLHTHTSSPW